MKVSDPKYLKISKPARAQVARMGRPHAESDSYYAAHYNRCVKEERERKGKTSADGRGMSLSAAAPVAVQVQVRLLLLLRAEGAVKISV